MSRAWLRSIPSLPATNILFSLMPFDILTYPLPLALVLCRRKPLENRSDTKCIQKWPNIVGLILKWTKCVGKPCGRKFLRGLVWVSDLHGYMQVSCCCMVFDLPFLENSITHYTNIIMHADILKGEIASMKGSLEEWLCYGCAKVIRDLLLVTCEFLQKNKAIRIVQFFTTMSQVPVWWYLSPKKQVLALKSEPKSFSKCGSSVYLSFSM